MSVIQAWTRTSWFTVVERRLGLNQHSPYSTYMLEMTGNIATMPVRSSPPLVDSAWRNGGGHQNAKKKKKKKRKSVAREPFPIFQQHSRVDQRTAIVRLCIGHGLLLARDPL